MGFFEVRCMARRKEHTARQCPRTTSALNPENLPNPETSQPPFPWQIHALAFSPAGIQPPLLAACSSHGSVHIFRLQQESHVPPGQAKATSLATGLLSSLVKMNVADMVSLGRRIGSGGGEEGGRLRGRRTQQGLFTLSSA